MKAAKGFPAVMLTGPRRQDAAVAPAVSHGELLPRLADALKRKHAKAAGTKIFLVHQSPQAGTPTRAVAPGVRALPWQEFLDAL